jgi:hypothetical protein
MIVLLKFVTSPTIWTKVLIRLKAITPLLHKHAPGLVHGMLAASLAVTPCESSKTKF